MNRVAGIPDLQGVFDAQPVAPHLLLPAGTALTAVEQTASSGATAPALNLGRDDGGNGALGDGVALDLSIINSAGALTSAMRISAEWLDATASSEDSEVVFSSRIAGIFAEGLRIRPLGIDLQFVTPFAFVLSPNSDLDDGLRISVTTNDTFVIPQRAANAFNLGNTVADPSVNLNRTNARAFEMIPLGTTITSNTPGDWLALPSVVTLDAPSISFGGFVAVSGTLQFRQSGSAFGAGNLFKISGTFKNESGFLVSIGSQYTFVHVGTYQADGVFAQSNFFHRVCLFQPTWNVINGATMTTTTVNVGGLINPSQGAGVTFTNMRDWEWSAGTFSGTTVNRSHLYMPATNTPAATIFEACRSIIAASANHRFIRHIGTAESDFGGPINLGAGATFDWQIQRAAANRADIAAGDSLRFVDGELQFVGTAERIRRTAGALELDAATRVTINAVLNHTLSDALGGGATPTFGTIGGSGPTAAAQATWIRVELSGVTHWIPAWV